MSEETSTVKTQNVFIKCRFKSSSRNLYGLALLQFHPSGTVENSQSITSTFSELYEIDPQSGWDEYEEQIIKTKWSGKYNQNISRDLQVQIEGTLEDTFQRTQIFEAANDYDFTSVEQIFYDIIRHILQDKNIKLEINIQEVTNEEISKVRQAREDSRKSKYEKPESSGDFDIEEGASLLPSSLVLAPVNGKPLYELKIGDKIMVKLDPKSVKNQHFISQYGLKTENNTYLPLPGEVIDIKATSKSEPVQILSRIDDRVYSRCVEEERQVKLRIYNSGTDRSIQAMKAVARQKNNVAEVKSKVNPGKPKGKASNMTVILSIVLASLILLLIVAIYLLL